MGLDAIVNLEAAAEALAERVTNKVMEKLSAALRAEFERHAGRDGGQAGGIHQLKDWIGAETLAGCKSTVHRDPELAALAFRSGNARRWRRAEVEALLERRRADANQPKRKRLRAVEGGR